MKMKMQLPIHDELALESQSRDAVAIVGRRLWALYVCIRIGSWLAAFCAMLIVAGLISTDDLPNRPTWLWPAFIATSLLAISHNLIWQKLQYSRIGYWLVSDIHENLPAAFKETISDYARGSKRVETINGTVSYKLFQSHWAMTLWFDDSDCRSLVRSRKGYSTAEQLFPVPLNATQPLAVGDAESGATPRHDEAVDPLWRYYKKCAGDAAENRNANPDDQWIVGQGRDRYEASRKRSVAETAPHRAEQKAFILDGIRHELRAGGQRGSKSHATNEIEQELLRVFGSQPLFRADSIAKLMSSGAHNAALRAHFESEFK